MQLSIIMALTLPHTCMLVMARVRVHGNGYVILSTHVIVVSLFQTLYRYSGVENELEEITVSRDGNT